MAAEDASEYECLKAAILKRYNINEDTYRVRFRAVAQKPEEGYAEMATRILDLLRKWMRVYIHGGGHGEGGGRADAQLAPS